MTYFKLRNVNRNYFDLSQPTYLGSNLGVIKGVAAEKLILEAAGVA